MASKEARLGQAGSSGLLRRLSQLYLPGHFQLWWAFCGSLPEEASVPSRGATAPRRLLSRGVGGLCPGLPP